MAQIRIQDIGYTKHIQELTESASVLQQIGGDFTASIEQAAASWEGDGATTWKNFGERAKEAHEKMTSALSEMQQKIEGVAQASSSGQAKQNDAVSQRENSADWQGAEFSFK